MNPIESVSISTHTPNSPIHGMVFIHREAADPHPYFLRTPARLARVQAMQRRMIDPRTPEQIEDEAAMAEENALTQWGDARREAVKFGSQL